MKKYKKLLLKSPPFKTGKNLEWGGGTWNVELHEVQFSWDGKNFSETRFGTSIVCKTEDSENHVYSTILRSYEDALKEFNERYENPMEFLTA
tara:strand:- start:40 stop:315 length:276 start_codon:yes stop_codon:yes gene_type:complete